MGWCSLSREFSLRTELGFRLEAGSLRMATVFHLGAVGAQRNPGWVGEADPPDTVL